MQRLALARELAKRGNDQVLLVCSKCERRLEKQGRFRQAHQLRAAWSRASADAQTQHPALQILETQCMDICPEGAVAVCTRMGAGLYPAEVQIVRTADDVQSLCDEMRQRASAGDTSLDVGDELTTAR